MPIGLITPQFQTRRPQHETTNARCGRISGASHRPVMRTCCEAYPENTSAVGVSSSLKIRRYPMRHAQNMSHLSSLPRASVSGLLHCRSRLGLVWPDMNTISSDVQRARPRSIRNRSAKLGTRARPKSWADVNRARPRDWSRIGQLGGGGSTPRSCNEFDQGLARNRARLGLF